MHINNSVDTLLQLNSINDSNGLTEQYYKKITDSDRQS